MTLLITLLAAIVATIVWYKDAPKDSWKLSILCYLYWGASLMWFVDAVFKYVELRAAYFNQDPMTMLNDAFLGVSAVTLGLVIWLARLLVKDPKGILPHSRMDETRNDSSLTDKFIKEK